MGSIGDASLPWTCGDGWLAAEGEIADYRRLVSSFESVAAWDSNRANLTGDGEPVRIGTASVTAGTFETLGARSGAPSSAG